MNYFNYYDEFSGIRPITVIRHWTFRDEAGNEETCTQTIPDRRHTGSGIDERA